MLKKSIKLCNELTTANLGKSSLKINVLIKKVTKVISDLPQDTLVKLKFNFA